MPLSSNDFVIDFPDELKESYEAFLKEALNQVQFELNKADKESNDTYIIRVTYEPIDIAATTKETDAGYVKNISGHRFHNRGEKSSGRGYEAFK